MERAPAFVEIKILLIDSFTLSVLSLGCSGLTPPPLYLLFKSQKCLKCLHFSWLMDVAYKYKSCRMKEKPRRNQGRAYWESPPHPPFFFEWIFYGSDRTRCLQIFCNWKGGEGEQPIIDQNSFNEQCFINFMKWTIPELLLHLTFCFMRWTFSKFRHGGPSRSDIH